MDPSRSLDEGNAASRRTVVVRVDGVPTWMRWRRLLGPGEWSAERDEVATDPVHPRQPSSMRYRAELTRSQAADLAARLRGVAFDGRPVDVYCQPALDRRATRAARLDEARRHRHSSSGFERRDVRLDEDGRFSLTPERIALAIGRLARGASVVDACAGAGGNTIGFARTGCRVHAIELDGARAAMARHNLARYGMSQRVTVETGDATNRVPELSADVLFIDPPWGRDYSHERVGLDDLPLVRSLLGAAARYGQVWLKLPASFDTNELAGARALPCFGVATGDRRRVKFLLVVLPGERRSS